MQNLIKHSGDVTIFNLIGNFDGGKDCQNTNQLFNDMITKGRRKFVINCALVRWINSNGIGCIIAAKKTVDKVGGKLVLCNLEKRDLSTIYKMRLEEVFEIKGNLHEALDSLKDLRAQAAADGEVAVNRPEPG
jgi:anti-anti-sigma factor